jgi:hypothetical protein
MFYSTIKNNAPVSSSVGNVLTPLALKEYFHASLLSTDVRFKRSLKCFGWCDYAVYRALTSVVFHGGILHIAFNMLAFVPLGRCAIALSHRLNVFVGKGADAQAHGAFSLDANVEQLS